VVEAEEDISSDPAQVVFPAACPTDHSYAEEVAGIQGDSYWVLERGMLVVVVAVGEELMGLWKLLRRPSQGLQSRQDP
jgi:hypothetical protein